MRPARARWLCTRRGRTRTAPSAARPAPAHPAQGQVRPHLCWPAGQQGAVRWGVGGSREGGQALGCPANCRTHAARHWAALPSRSAPPLPPPTPHTHPSPPLYRIGHSAEQHKGVVLQPDLCQSPPASAWVCMGRRSSSLEVTARMSIGHGCEAQEQWRRLLPTWSLNPNPNPSPSPNQNPSLGRKSRVPEAAPHTH